MKEGKQFQIGVKILGKAVELQTLVGRGKIKDVKIVSGHDLFQGQSNIDVDGEKVSLTFVNFYSPGGNEHWNKSWQQGRLIVFHIDDPIALGELGGHVDTWQRRGRKLDDLFIVGCLGKHSPVKASIDKIQNAIISYDGIKCGVVDSTNPQHRKRLRKAIAGQMVNTMYKGAPGLLGEETYFEKTLNALHVNEHTAAYETGLVFAQVSRNSIFPTEILTLIRKHYSADTPESLRGAFHKGIENGLRIKFPFDYNAVVRVAKHLGGLDEDPMVGKGAKAYLKESVKTHIPKTEHGNWKSHIQVVDAYRLFDKCNKKMLASNNIKDKPAFVDKFREQEKQQANQGKPTVERA